MAINYDFYLKRDSGTIKYFKWNIKIEQVATNNYKWTLWDYTQKGWKTPSGSWVDVDASTLWNTNANDYITVYFDSQVVYIKQTGAVGNITKYGTLSSLPSTIKVVVHHGSSNSYMISGVSSNLSSVYKTEISRSVSGTPETINPGGGGGGQFVWNGTANVFWG